MAGGVAVLYFDVLAQHWVLLFFCFVLFRSISFLFVFFYGRANRMVSSSTSSSSSSSSSSSFRCCFFFFLSRPLVHGRKQSKQIDTFCLFFSFGFFYLIFFLFFGFFYLREVRRLQVRPPPPARPFLFIFFYFEKRNKTRRTERMNE